MHNEGLCLLFRFSCVFIAQIIDAVCKFIPLPQPMTSNPQSKPCDRFYSRYVFIKTNRAFSEDCHYPKKPGNTPLSGTYLSFFDIKQTVSTWHELLILMSNGHFGAFGICFRPFLVCGNLSTHYSYIKKIAETRIK